MQPLPLVITTQAPELSLRSFASITKPGIILGNLIAVVGGYFLGSRGEWDSTVFLGTLGGIALVIGSAGAFNNVIDRDIDPLMERTRSRALANGSLSPVPALLFASTLALAGFAMLVALANIPTAAVALFGFFAYVVLYSLGLKRTSIHGTLVGSISGAIPPLVGFTAATARIDLSAILLVLALCFWQMPHSYAIGIFRDKDFRAANIPLLPLLYSVFRTKVTMLAYTILFAVAVLALPYFGFVGSGFAWTMGAASFAWILLTAAGFRSQNNTIWARRVFFSSLWIVTLLSLALVFDAKPILF